jgi:hypothetical protein
MPLPGFILDRVVSAREITFDSPIQILTNQTTSNGAGGQTDNWVVTRTVTGRLRRRPRPGDQRNIGNEVQSIMHWQCLMDPLTPISVTNRMNVNGRIFTVLSHDSGRSDALCLVVDCLPLDEI